MKYPYLTLLAAGLLAASVAQAMITIDTVIVGDSGNANDTTGYGGVSYEYHIGTYPVTNAQYTTFLNAVAATDTHGLWNSNMGSNVHGGISRGGSDGSYTYSVRTADSGYNNGQSMGNMPVNYVSFWDAARFTNWLTTGDTETGVYVLDATGIANNTITRDATAWAAGGVAIASENEWYKAAYYDGSGSYWTYPTQSNTFPTATTPNSTNANSANYSGSLAPDSDTVTPVGGYTLADSHYGTFDQGGNVTEWNEAIMNISSRGVRGGSFVGGFDGFYLQSSTRNGTFPSNEDSSGGFRVTSITPIPEPSTYAAILGGLGLLLAFMRRRDRV